MDLIPVIFIFSTTVFLCFLIWKPKIGLNITIAHNNLIKKILKTDKISFLGGSKLVGIDENNRILPDGEKRFRIFMSIFVLLWISSFIFMLMI